MNLDAMQLFLLEVATAWPQSVLVQERYSSIVYVLITFEAFVALFVTLTLFRFLPKRIRNVAIHNCYRMDGSKSFRRRQSEGQALVMAFGSFLVFTFFVLLITDLVIFFLGSFVVNDWTLGPISIQVMLLLAMCVWVIVAILLIRGAYFAILRMYYAGLKKRSERYLERDSHAFVSRQAAKST